MMKEKQMIRWERSLAKPRPVRPVCDSDQLFPQKRNTRIMICVFTIVSGASDQEFTQQQKSSDIPSAQM